MKSENLTFKAHSFLTPVGFLGVDAPAEKSRFAAVHFAARRANFILREHVKATEESNELKIPQEEAKPAQERPEAVAKTLEELDPNLRLIPESVLEQKVKEAEERGRNKAITEMGASVESALTALSLAGQEYDLARRELEKNIVIPFSKACIAAAEKIARFALETEHGMERYLAAVEAEVIQADRGAPEQEEKYLIHLNSSDLNLLKNFSSERTSYLVSDDAISRGGALIKFGDKIVDDRFDNRLREIKEKLLALVSDLMRPQSESDSKS